MGTGLPTTHASRYVAALTTQSAVCQLRGATLLPVVAEMLGKDPAHAALLLELYDVNGSLPTAVGTPSDTTLLQLRLLVEALATVRGLGAAWHACRAWLAAQPDEAYMHDVLYGTLLQHCFAPPRREAIQALLALPLDAPEEQRLQDYALAPGHAAPHEAAVVVDTLLLKWINEGRYLDAIHLDRRAAQMERTHAFHASSDAARVRHRRKALIDGVWSILPAVQRDALAADLGPEPMRVDDAPAQPEAPPARPQTPLSASLGAARAPSSAARTLAKPTRTPSRSAAKGAASLRDAPSPLRSNSPFAGWKRAAAGSVPSPAREREPAWGLPIPSAPARPPAPDVGEAAADAEMDEEVPAALHAEHEPMDDGGEADGGADDDVPESVVPDEVSDAAMPEADDAEESAPDGTEDEREAEREPTPEAPRRRRGARRAAQRANVALRKALRTDEEPAIPGGFPLSAEAAPAPSPARAARPRRSSRVAGDALPSSASLSALASPAGRVPRSATQADVAYPQASLARLEALHDTRPIARRTRAQTAELESHGSQASDGEAPEAPATPARRRRRSPAPLATPQLLTRSARRLRDGSAPGTPRSVGRRRSEK